VMVPIALLAWLKVREKGPKILHANVRS
jgi:hypothetical protein